MHDVVLICQGEVEIELKHILQITLCNFLGRLVIKYDLAGRAAS
jgi:hypothetical protein